MIKKSVFENDLITGMQIKLASMQETLPETIDFNKVIDHLNDAAEILDDAGFSSKSEKVIAILSKVASHISDNRKVILTHYLDQYGVSKADINALTSENPIIERHAQRKINRILFDAGVSENDRSKILREDFISDHDLNMIKEKKIEVIPSASTEPFQLRRKANKHKNHRKHHDNKLTSDQMVKNYLDHGTAFNLADDGAFDESNADDILNVEIDADSDGEYQGDFEDEV